jgi:hypothetical protein
MWAGFDFCFLMLAVGGLAALVLHFREGQHQMYLLVCVAVCRSINQNVALDMTTCAIQIATLVLTFRIN